jgi:P27 family predicted phage terminase small subunit
MPSHLSATAKPEWKRLAQDPNRIGLPIWIDRAVLAAYCQACGSWVKAHRKQSDRPTIFKGSAGYVHAPPRLTISKAARAQGHGHGGIAAHFGISRAVGSASPQRAEAVGDVLAPCEWASNS